MSALTRDPAGFVPEPPLTRRLAGPAARAQTQWSWPDPQEVVPPPVASVAGRASAPTVPIAARWPVQPPPQSWPPLPGQERAAALQPDPIPDVGAIPSALYSPVPEPEVAPRPAAQSAGLPLAWQTLGPIPVEAPRAADPSPSRMAYRLNRMWLTPAVRHFVHFGLPVLLIAAFAAGWLSDEGRRAQIVEGVASVRAAIENRPEFQVLSIDVQSRSPEVAQGVAQLLGVSFPISSWQLDLAELRRTAEALDAVEQASLQVRGGVLEVRIQERMPAMIWRNRAGLDLIDASGHRVARLATRSARPDLPLIAGEGAPDAIAEARLLWAAATPLQARIRGLVRVGERRWDIQLDRDQTIMLPAEGALGALERVLALQATQGLLDRDIVAVDLRNPSRPTLRLSEGAMRELNRIRHESTGARNR